MKINVKDLPMTIDTVRQEVIKKEGEKMVIKYEQKYINAAMFLITIPFGMLILALTLNGGNRISNIISMPVFTLMSIGCLSFIFVIRGKAEKEYYRENRHTNFGLSEDEVDKKVMIYLHDIRDKMDDELMQSEKDIIALQQTHTAMHNAYYEPLRVYLQLIDIISK